MGYGLLGVGGVCDRRKEKADARLEFGGGALERGQRLLVASGDCGHPGYVPDDYLEHLDGMGIETTITAAELCIIGTWERVGGGYRVLDWEAVEVCLDQVRQILGEDPQALAWEAEHEAKIQACMATPIVATPPCAACGTPATRVELVAPGQLPAQWGSGPAAFKTASRAAASQDSGTS